MRLTQTLSLLPVLAMSAVVLAAGLATGYQFLPEGDNSDGFAVQISYVSSLLQDGELLARLDEGWLLLVHAARAVAVAPFVALAAVVGPVGPLLLLLLLLWPLTRAPESTRRSALTMAPLLLPLLVSGRSVLVAVGVGYVVMHLLERRRSWMLWAGAFLVNLSSASVLMALIILLAGDHARTPLPRSIAWQRAAVLGLLLASLGMSLADKVTGFAAGSLGYEAHAFESENVVLSILSRSTLFVSLVEGQYLRALVYAAVAFVLAAKLLTALLNPRQRVARRVVLCCLPGILLEGLGVIAMTFPLVWLLRGFAADRRRRVLPAPRSA